MARVNKFWRSLSCCAIQWRWICFSITLVADLRKSWCRFFRWNVRDFRCMKCMNDEGHGLPIRQILSCIEHDLAYIECGDVNLHDTSSIRAMTGWWCLWRHDWIYWWVDDWEDREFSNCWLICLQSLCRMKICCTVHAKSMSQYMKVLPESK